MDIAIHINTALAHQVKHAQCFRAGFAKHGLQADITSIVELQADLHVVSGPWYAKRQWLKHPRVIYIDRCHYRGNPEHVSLGWLKPDGGREFRQGEGRTPPAVKPLKDSRYTIFLEDYGGPREKADHIRYHPAHQEPSMSLRDDLKPYGVAIGYMTTALVIAALEGLRVDCRDKRSIMAQPDWLDILPYADWSHNEIANGDAWEHLKS